MQVPEDRRWRNARSRNRYLLAQLLSQLDDEDALRLANESIEELTELVEHDPQNTDWQRALAFANTVMAHACYQFDRPEAALAHAERAVTLSRELYESDTARRDWRALLGRAAIARAVAQHRLGDQAAALGSLDMARQIAAQGASQGDGHRFLLASVELTDARIKAAGSAAIDPSLFAEALRLSRENLPIASAVDRAVWAEASLRSGAVVEATATVEALLAAGYRERDFMQACDGVVPACRANSAAD